MSNFMDRFRLDDKVAIVTGAGKGIGKATALVLAEAGAHVVCAARTLSDIEETAGQIRAGGRLALAVVCDVTQEAQLEQLVGATRDEFGRIDILVNNAASHIPAAALDISADDFERAVRISLTSPFLLTKLAAQVMAKTGGGSVVNISSVGSYMPLKGFASYGAAKAGLNQLINILAHEFAPKVRVNGIIVGSVETPGSAAVSAQVASVMARKAGKPAGQPALTDEDKRKMAAAMIPLGRRGQPDDIAAGVIYLASPASSWITGTMIHITGGASAPSVGGGGGYPVPEL